MNSSNGTNGVLRVTRLVLENWRNFKEVDVALPRRVFLVGPNASGKSNLLDAVRLLHDIVAVGGGLQAAIDQKRGGMKRVRCLAARKTPDVHVQVTIGTDDQDALWRYAIRFGSDSSHRPILRSELAWRQGEPVLKRPTPDDLRDPERLRQTHLEQLNVNQDFREIAHFFDSVRYLHVVPQLVREPDRSVGRRNDPFGGDFLEQLAQAPEKTRRGRLGRIKKALRIAVPQFREFELERDSRGVPHIRARYDHWRPQGAWQSEQDFSDGTLRLLGLLWATLEGTGPLLLEEPELSLHPDVVRHLPQMFARMQSRSGRQILISTHSPDLLRDDGIGLDEVLLLTPGAEATEVAPASERSQIGDLISAGLTLADAVIPLTRPVDAEQLALFVDDP